MRESVLTNYPKTSSDGCPVTHYQPSCGDVVAMTMTLWPMRAMKKQKSLNVVQSHGLLPAKTSPPMTSWWCHAREKLGRTSTQKKCMNSASSMYGTDFQKRNIPFLLEGLEFLPFWLPNITICLFLFAVNLRRTKTPSSTSKRSAKVKEKYVNQMILKL